jgi:hypothetical protein
MELSSSWETACCADIQELSSILWYPEVHYLVHKSPPLVPIVSQIKPVHATQPISLRPILILSTHLHLGLSSGLFPSGFPTIILYVFLFSHLCYMPCPSHPPWFEYSNYTWRRAHSPHYVVFSNLLSLHLPSNQIFFSNTLSLCSSPNVKRPSFTPIQSNRQTKIQD